MNAPWQTAEFQFGEALTEPLPRESFSDYMEREWSMSTAEQEAASEVCEPAAGSNNWFDRRARKVWEECLLPLGPFQSYLEVGIGGGTSMLWASEHLIGPEGRMVGIDHWQPPRPSFETSVRWIADLKAEALGRLAGLLRTGRLQVIEMTSRRALGLLAFEERRFDLAYIDGAHDAANALTDMCLAWGLLFPGGIMVLDDLHLSASRRRQPGPKVREAADAFMRCHNDWQVAFDRHPQMGLRKLDRPPSRRQLEKGTAQCPTNPLASPPTTTN